MNNRKAYLTPGSIWKHFKGNHYQILTIAIHSETQEEYVVYRPYISGKNNNDSIYKTYIRPLDMFLSEVDKEKYPDVKQKYRFALIISSLGQ